jgi:uncharacterized protein (DUF2147 family)
MRHRRLRSVKANRIFEPAEGGGAVKKISVLVFLFLTVSSVCSASVDDILGVWYNQEKDARIEIYKCGVNYCGKVVWLQEPNYPEGSQDGVPGTPKLDHNNPDPTRRRVPIIGLQIVRDFRYDGENKWADGNVYDPKNGKTYSGKITLVSPRQLNLRGYILGIPFLGRTAIWTR